MSQKKNYFITAMNSLRGQRDYDKAWSQSVSHTFKVDLVPTYDNENLVSLVVLDISYWFQNTVEVEQEIYRFINELDFGRCEGSEIISAEDFWDRLCNEFVFASDEPS